MEVENVVNKLLRITVPAVVLAAGVATVGHAGTVVHREPDRQGARVVRIADARLTFEINATDGDGGVQVFLDAKRWRRMSIFDPDGRRVLTTMTDGVMAKQGGTELFLESAEPTFDVLPLAELLQRWPAGRYEFRGVGVNGEKLRGSARLTHDLPEGPTLVAPAEGGRPQDPNHTVLRWQSVPPPNGSAIIGYQVLVVDPDTGIKALPTTTLDIMMPPTGRRLRVPPGFLEPGMEYEWEVLALEESGNQTLSSSTFATRE